MDFNQNSTRSNTVASIVLLGLTGAGKSTTFNKLFGTSMESIDCYTSVTSTIIEDRVKVHVPGTEGAKELLLIDTPGFGDTRQRSHERDAQLLATLESYLRKHPVLKSSFPSVVMLVMKFNDDRIVYETSKFIQMLKALNSLVSTTTLIDQAKSSCNLVVVLTHIMSESNPTLRLDPTPKFKAIEGLFREYTTIEPPLFIVMGENKPELFDLPMNQGYWRLPNGDHYPYNLYEMIDKITQNSNDIVANEIFREAFKNPLGLHRYRKGELHLEKVESPNVNRYKIQLQNCHFRLENTEIFRTIQEIWDNLPPQLTTKTGNLLQHVQRCFHLNKICAIEDLPRKADQIVNLISKLPLLPAVKRILEGLRIQAPRFPDDVLQVGKFYDISADRCINYSPFDIGPDELSPVGFSIPPYLSVVDLYHRNKVFTLHENRSKYVEERYRQLGIYKEVSEEIMICEPTPGNNIKDVCTRTGAATGIFEYKVYKIELKNKRFSDEYANLLHSLPKYSSGKSSPEWLDFVRRGSHVLKLAYAGGYAQVTATHVRNSEMATPIAKVRHVIDELLIHIGEYFTNTKLFTDIRDFEFTVDFYGGDPSLRRVGIHRIFSQEGTEFFKKWQASLSLYPILLTSEMELENVCNLLPPELLIKEGSLRKCLAASLNIREKRKQKNRGPVERGKIKKKKEKEQCRLM